MGASVGAVDHGIGGALQLVVETTVDQPADDRIVEALTGKHVAGRAALDAALGQATVNALDDVATLAQLPQRRLGILGHDPLSGADLIGEAEGLQLAEAADLHRMEFVGLAVRERGEIDDAGAIAVAGKLAVKIGPALRVDLPFEIAADLVIGARPQLLGDEVLRAGAPMTVRTSSSRATISRKACAPAQDDMDMWIIRVPVIDADPVELGAEVCLHLPHQLAGESLEVGHLGRVLR